MSDGDRKIPAESPGEEESRSPGPSLLLAYSLIAIALLVAIAMAALIVWPYYKAR
jgi:hypothetical protein